MKAKAVKVVVIVSLIALLFIVTTTLANAEPVIDHVNGTWSDSFDMPNATAGIASSTNVTVSDGDVNLTTGNSTGNLTSIAITPSSLLYNWDKFYANDTINASQGTNITYEILNATDNSTLCTVTSTQANAGYNISSCASGVRSIRLYAELTTTNTLNTPVLHDWNVSWIEAILLLEANPQTVFANGNDTSTITATVLVNNTPVEGVNVNFSTNVTTITNLTNSSGQASVVLKGTTKIQNVTVNASIDGLTNSAVVYFVAGPPHDLIVTANPDVIATLADGYPVNKSNITALVVDEWYHALSGLRVNFTTTNGSLSSDNETTNSYGEATVILTASDTEGNVTVNATIDNLTSSTTVRFRNRPFLIINTSIYPKRVPELPAYVNVTHIITGVAAPPGIKTEYVKVVLPGVIDNGVVIPNATYVKGSVSIWFIPKTGSPKDIPSEPTNTSSGNNQTLIFEIKKETSINEGDKLRISYKLLVNETGIIISGDSVVEAKDYIQNFGQPVPGPTIEGTGDGELGNAPPVAKITITASDKVHVDKQPMPIQFDGSGSYDPDGTIVNYTWTFGDGNITTTTNEIITHNYSAEGIYTVTLIVTDNNGEESDPVATTVTVFSMTVSESRTRIWVTGQGVDTALITVNATSNGTAVSGVPIKFSTSLGTLNTETRTTDGDGLATVTLTSGDTPGSATITATEQYSYKDVSTVVEIKARGTITLE